MAGANFIVDTQQAHLLRACTREVWLPAVKRQGGELSRTRVLQMGEETRAQICNTLPLRGVHACTDCGFPAQGGRDGYCDDQEVPRHPWFRSIRGTQKTKTKKMESGSPSRTRLETVPRRIDNVGEASSTAKNARSRPARGLLCLASYGNLPFWDCKSGVAPGLEEESDRIEKKSGEQAYQRALADSGKCKLAFLP